MKDNIFEFIMGGAYVCLICIMAWAAFKVLGDMYT